MNSDLMAAIGMLEEEKKITKDTIFDAIEAALLTASKNHFGNNDNIKVVMDRETGEYKLYQLLEVVRDEDFVDPKSQITKDALKEQYGEKLKLGEFYQKEFVSADFGRIASQNAKSVILQKLREAERKSIYDTFAEKQHNIATGKIVRKTARNVIINLGTADALLGENDQIKGENYYVGSRIRVYIKDVQESKTGLKIIASRTAPDFVAKLFEEQVAEIQNGVVEVKAIAREAGSRTKMAVWSNDPNVDPVGACIGFNGTRVGNVVEELGGENVDVINWSDVSAEFIENAIKPANVVAISADDEDKTSIVIVGDNQLSLAIGRAGQNARLVAKLTGYKIDIKSESEAEDLGIYERSAFDEEEYDEEEYEDVEEDDDAEEDEDVEEDDDEDVEEDDEEDSDEDEGDEVDE